MPDAIIVEDVTLTRFAHREAIHFPLVISQL
jgi:collagenase-like PrtC family protease